MRAIKSIYDVVHRRGSWSSECVLMLSQFTTYRRDCKTLSERMCELLAWSDTTSVVTMEMWRNGLIGQTVSHSSLHNVTRRTHTDRQTDRQTDGWMDRLLVLAY